MAHEVTSLRSAEEEAAGVKSDLPTASILKVRGTEMVQRIGDMMVDALGDAGTPYFAEDDYVGAHLPNDPPAPDYAPGVAFDFLYRRSMTIYGGTNEIQRNIIASMLLRA
jgi:acyl-CoA dehydrogenase